MKKAVKMKPYVGALVVMNDLDDATVFKVVEVVGAFTIGVVQANLGPKQRVQWVDVTMAKLANKVQLKNDGLEVVAA